MTEYCMDCKEPLCGIGGIFAGWGRLDIKTGSYLGGVCNECHGRKPDKIPSEIYEWEFDEPSRLVCMERMYDEVNGSGATVILQTAYLSALRREAPIIYDRFKKWSIENKKNQWWKDFNIEDNKQ